MENKWVLTSIDSKLGIFKVKDDKGNIVVCKVRKNKMKFPKGVIPPDYIVDDINHYLENSGMIICDNENCPHRLNSNRDCIDLRGYGLCKHPKGVVYNISKKSIIAIQESNGYFKKTLCKMSIK